MMASSQESFNSEWASPAEWAAMYRALGIQVVPGYLPSEKSDWKRPKLSQWVEYHEALTPDATFARWYGPGGEHYQRPNMGLITGRASGNIFVIDLDLYKTPSALSWWSGVLAEHNNRLEIETWEQRTGGNGRQMLLRAPAGWHAPTNRTPIGVDIRGQGGFAVLPPSHHSSGSGYQWEAGREPWSIECAMAPEWLLRAVEELVEKYGGDTNRAGTGPSERTASPSEDFDAFGSRKDGREDFMARLIWGVIVDLYRECPIRPNDEESAARMRQAYEGYERNVKTRVEGTDKTSGLEREGRGPSEFSAKWRYALAQWDGDVATAAAHARPGDIEQGSRASDPPPRDPPREPPPPGADGPDDDFGSSSTGPGAQTVFPIKLQSAFPIAENAIPPRDWIIPGLLLKKHLSVLVAPPGSGKSLLTLQLAIAGAVGLAWGGWKLRKPVKVLVVNAEDDMDEMRRRLVAAAGEMKVDQRHLADRIFLADAPETIVIARTDGRSKAVIRTPLLEQLIETIKSSGVECVIVDPFAETFEGDENSNSEVKWAGILWREVARRTGASVFLVHHTRKYAGAMAGDADASRGGGALIGTARILSTLFGMTEDEATVMSIRPEDRTRYVRFDDAKANLSLVTGCAKWFEKISVTLGNGSGIIPGDEVGVLREWSPPGLLSAFSIDRINEVLDVIARGIVSDEGATTGDRYTVSAAGRGNERWVGRPIARLLECDDDKAKAIIKAWLESGLLVSEDYKTSHREIRKGVRVEDSKRPGTVS